MVSDHHTQIHNHQTSHSASRTQLTVSQAIGTFAMYFCVSQHEGCLFHTRLWDFRTTKRPIVNPPSPGIAKIWGPEMWVAT